MSYAMIMVIVESGRDLIRRVWPEGGDDHQLSLMRASTRTLTRDAIDALMEPI
jgi:hypothetical protein